MVSHGFFVAEIMMYGLVSITKNNHAILTVVSVALILISFAVNGFIGKLPIPFQLWKGVEITGFMALGYVLREWLKSLEQHRLTAYIVICFTFFVSLLGVYFPSRFP